MVIDTISEKNGVTRIRLHISINIKQLYEKIIEKDKVYIVESCGYKVYVYIVRKVA